MELPKTKEDLERLISIGKQEDIHLDYKNSKALDKNKSAEIAKDVSAFANADGGMIIYGIDEKNHLPEKLDGGADHAKLSREWLEDVITSNITPKIEDVEITQIPLSETHSAFIVKIPKSFRGPHQERLESKRYYKRYNFKSLPMDHYEIEDVRSRRSVVQPLVRFYAQVKRSLVQLVLSNVADIPALDVQLEFSKELVWPLDLPKPTNIIEDGVNFLAAQQKMVMIYGSYEMIIKEGSGVPIKFDATVSYLHPNINRRISETFHIDLPILASTLVNESEIERLDRSLSKHLRELVGELRKLNQKLDR